jgi:alkylhydroperoxidase family enzyme
MTRLPVFDVDDCPPAQRDVLLEWGRDRGQKSPPGKLWRMMAASPNGMRAVAKLGAFVRVGTRLDPVLQEVAVLVASSQRGFEFEINLHEAKLRTLGVDPASVYKARDGQPTGLTVAADAVAAFAYAVARGEHVNDTDFAQLLAMLGVEHLIEILTVIGYYLMISDFAKVLEPDT